MHRPCALCVCLLFFVMQPAFARQAAPAASGSAAVPAPGEPPAQQVAPTGPPAPVSPRTADSVQLDVTVTDRSGKPVPDLQPGDFAVFDNGRPTPIVSFRARSPDPQTQAEPLVHVVLLIDTMNGDFNSVASVRAEVERFLRQNGGRLAYPVSVDWITEKGIKTQADPTLDGIPLADELAAVASRLRVIIPSQGIYGVVDRFQISIQILRILAREEIGQPGKKLFIWIGPGWPLLGGPGADLSAQVRKGVFAEIVELSTLLRQARISLFSISQGQAGPDTFYYQDFLKGVRREQDVSAANLNTKVLAVQSGGLAEPPSNDLVSSINACIRGAGTFYTVSFNPPPAAGPNEYHKLEVRVGRPGLTVRTSTGYYNQPPGLEPDPQPAP